MGQQIVVTNGAGGMPVVCLIEEEREKNPKVLPYLYQALSLGVVKLCQGKIRGILWVSNSYLRDTL